MEIITTNKLELNLLDLPFHLNLVWNKKRGVENDYWFTPTGICKIYIGALHNNYIGDITTAEYKALLKEMNFFKCAILSDGVNYYTVGDTNIMSIDNFSSINRQMMAEWDRRKYVEYWVEDDRVYRRNEYDELVLA